MSFLFLYSSFFSCKILAVNKRKQRFIIYWWTNPIRIEENNIKNLTKSAVLLVASWILIRNSSKESVSKSQLSRASQVIPKTMHIQVHLNGLYASPQVRKGPQVSSGTNQLLNASAWVCLFEQIGLFYCFKMK